MIVLSFKYDGDYLVEALARYRSSAKSRKVLLVVKLSALILLLLLAGFCLSQKAWILSAFFIFLGSLLFLSHHIDYWLARRSIIKSPFYNEVFRVELSEIGFAGNSAKSDCKLDWSVFAKVTHFKDGFLLLQNPRILNWLPISALVDPKQAPELENLLRAKIKVHEVIAKPFFNK